MIKIGIPTFISCLLLGISAVNADDMELKHRPLPLTIAQLDQITAGAFSIFFDFDAAINTQNFAIAKTLAVAIGGVAYTSGEVDAEVTPTSSSSYSSSTSFSSN